jgi:hypothetical protein
MPSYRWFSKPEVLDSAPGAETIDGDTLTGAVRSELRSVHTDSAQVHTILAAVPSDLAPILTALVAVHMDSALVHADLAPISLFDLSGHRGCRRHSSSALMLHHWE